MTRRPLNRCRECGYTWYPRGKSLSRVCPSCGGRDVKRAVTAEMVLGGGCLLLVLFAFCAGTCGRQSSPWRHETVPETTGPAKVVTPEPPRDRLAK